MDQLKEIRTAATHPTGASRGKRIKVVTWSISESYITGVMPDDYVVASEENNDNNNRAGTSTMQEDQVQVPVMPIIGGLCRG